MVSFFQNQLKSINIKNGKNSSLSFLNVKNNTKLYCIQVDDEFVPNGGADWLKDDLAFYSSTTCENLTYVPDDAFEAYLEANTMGDGILNNNFVLTANIESVISLNIDGMTGANLIGIEDFIALQNLDCSNNPNISSLDLSKNSALTSLICNNNSSLTNLDLSNNLEDAQLSVILSGHGWGTNNTNNAAEFSENTHNIKGILKPYM